MTRLRSGLGLLALLAVVPVAAAQPAGKATSPAATFLARARPADGFRSLPERAELPAGELLVTLPGAGLLSLNGAVSVQSLADYDGRSPLPALETAFTLNPPADGTDLDLTLDRGRIDLTNVRGDKPAVVKVRFWDQTWTVTLADPGTRVGVELYGRWPAGTRFKPGAEGAKPVASLVLLVLKGTATADVGGLALGLSAPPGPALVEWDSVDGVAPQPLKLDKLPDWADPTAALSADGRKAAAAVEKFRLARAADPAAALGAFLGSADPAERRVGLVTVGATDDLAALGKVLSGAKTRDEWDFGVTIARHWLGRSAGQDEKLYRSLTSPVHGYSPAHARIILQLLLGFASDDLQQPETFEVLIGYLTHDQSAVRNLAAWHLARLVPAGKGIAYTPSASKADCQSAYRAWKKLVPAGQLPAAAKDQ